MAGRHHVPHPSCDLFSDHALLKRRYVLEAQLALNKEVYRAWDAHFGTWVVIKQARGQRAAERLAHEAALLGRLLHPSLPRLIDQFESADSTYSLVEEWRPEPPMSRQQRFTLAEVVWIGQQLCDVLSYLHGLDLIHRDIKPDNILLQSGQALCLIDCDIMASTSDPWRKQWSNGYSAPEQRCQGLIHPQADIYSLGMLLGTSLLTCRPEEVSRTRSFAGLWGDLLSVEAEVRLLLDVLDRAIARRPVARPTLSEMQRVLDSVAVCGQAVRASSLSHSTLV